MNTGQKPKENGDARERIGWGGQYCAMNDSDKHRIMACEEFLPMGKMQVVEKYWLWEAVLTQVGMELYGKEGASRD